MTKATIDDIDVAGKRVLVRVDFNVPMEGERIIDDRRIQAALPTIRALRERGARVVVATHLGRPKGQVKQEFSTAPLAKRLGELLGVSVTHLDKVAGPEAEAATRQLKDGDVLMLENLRFDPGEEANDAAFAEKLAQLGDVYCNDAFGTAHRAHASTEGIAHKLPAVAGYLMAKELQVLGDIFENPARPLVAIIGGAKISTKIGLIEHLLKIVDTLWIGSAMACTFYRAQGVNVGKSMVETEWIPRADRLYSTRTQYHGELKLPIDLRISSAADGSASISSIDWHRIPADQMALDIGPKTIEAMKADIQNAGTVVWNGPLGLFEVPAFAEGTNEIGAALAECSGTTVVGGGDLVSALEQAAVTGKISFVSTGGGATLEFLEGKELPGVTALKERVPA